MYDLIKIRKLNKKRDKHMKFKGIELNKTVYNLYVKKKES